MKLTIDEVERRFKAKGYKLVPGQEYKGVKTKLYYTCKCGKENCITTINKINIRINCKNCSREKAKQTNLERFGVENPMQNKEVREKLEQTIIEKYGVKHPMHNEKVKEKFKKTNLERYGFEYTFQNKEVKEKIKQTNLERFGVDNPMKKEEIRDKAKQTNLLRYGSVYPIQNPEIFQRALDASFKTKFFTMPSSKIVSYQGYEDKALKILLDKYNEDDIVIGDINFIPTLKYKFKGKERIFYPDIYLKSENKIIEVKSKYTFFTRNYERNMTKIFCARDLNLEFWIMNKDGSILEIIKSSDFRC